MHNIKITTYSPSQKNYFKELNTEWLSKYFEVEPIDHQVLNNPQEEIIDKGGYIFYLSANNEIVGTVALIKRGDNDVELSKMAVTSNAQGQGFGQILLQHCIDFCAKNNIKDLFLYSNRKLDTAIKLYFKNGFIEIPMQENLYKRADIKMTKSIF